MENNKIKHFITGVLEHMPSDWLNLTTHRLDIYNEKLAKTQFLNQFDDLFQDGNNKTTSLSNLPTAFDYIRLGHPLSCILEWAIAQSNGIESNSVISFSSRMAPILAILRKNLLDSKHTELYFTDKLPDFFDAELLKGTYGYRFDLKKITSITEVQPSKNTKILISQVDEVYQFNPDPKIDFYINWHHQLGSILLVNGSENKNYISEIQHVRRRETIAMTPLNCQIALQRMTSVATTEPKNSVIENKNRVLDAIKKITDVTGKPLVASSGLSIQYAIMMGLVDHAIEKHAGKPIKFIVPTNCYGGTNDQARRVAACINNVEVVDLAVDGDSDMVQSIDTVLTKIANEDAVPYIIAEIPTNPRVEVPELNELINVLNKNRQTQNGNTAIQPVFILDQTFCPNIHFLGEGEVLSSVEALSYASGSKFPSGGKCTAGYSVTNKKADHLTHKIETHLLLCDNEATAQQYDILATQLPTMNQRISDAYQNTRAFVNYIKETLPAAKINFVSERLAEDGFTPSVFSLDLPTKGDTAEEKEAYKRKLNHQLINLMISEIPNESKYCVSYGQLKGCYWTIPATSTQGTTKEGDKDYIARVALAPDMDIERHKKVFLDFVNSI